MTESSMVVDLFETHRQLRAVIESVLEGVVGEVRTDGLETPRVARLDAGCYCFLAGDPTSSAARHLVADVCAPLELLIPNRQEWRNLLVGVHGRKLVDRPMRAFSTERLDRSHLDRMARDVPNGYQVRLLDRSGAEQLDSTLTPHALQVFPTVDQFLRSGFGTGAFFGDELVCAATSYAISSQRVEIAISTKATHRSHGLAAVVAARMILEAFDRALVPEWTASNPVSQRLAARLGYLPAELCDIFYLEAGD